MSFHDFKLSLIFLAGLCFASQAQAQNNVGIARGITLGTNPVRAVVTPNGSEMYISNSGSNTVSVINPTTNGLIATVAVGSQPSAVAVLPDGSKVFVGNQGGNVSVINTATKAVSTIVTGAPVRDLTITPDGSTVYLAMEFSGLKKIDVATSNVSTVSSVACPEALAVTPDGAKLYVNYQCFGPGGSPGHDAIGMFDASSGAFLGSITGLANVGGPIAISPDGSELWANGTDACISPAYDHVGCPFVGSGIVNIIDTGTNTKIGSIGFAGFSPGFITFASDSSLAIIDNGPSFMLFETLTFTKIGQGYAVK